MNITKPRDNIIRVGSASKTYHSFLRHAIIGDHCHIINSTILGEPGHPVIIGNNVTLINCDVQSTGVGNTFPFTFWGTQVPDRDSTQIRDYVSLSNSHVLNSCVGEYSKGFSASIEYSIIGSYNDLRSFAHITQSQTASACNLGAELSKSIILGDGFVSEHRSSYLSLMAPTDYPILDEGNRERLLTNLPNLSNIGSGTVFANYGGESQPTHELTEGPNSVKGTAVVYTAFICVNSRVVNRYGQPESLISPFALLRRRDLTILGFASIVEEKVTGRIPPFSYARGTSPGTHQLGWVLEHKPGIILNFIKKMRKQLGQDASRMREIIVGTLRLERHLLLEQLQRPRFYTYDQLKESVDIIERHLKDGRWTMDDNGSWCHKWRYNSEYDTWVCEVKNR